MQPQKVRVVLACEEMDVSPHEKRWVKESLRQSSSLCQGESEASFFASRVQISMAQEVIVDQNIDTASTPSHGKIHTKRTADASALERYQETPEAGTTSSPSRCESPSGAVLPRVFACVAPEEGEPTIHELEILDRTLRESQAKYKQKDGLLSSSSIRSKRMQTPEPELTPAIIPVPFSYLSHHPASPALTL